MLTGVGIPQIRITLPRDFLGNWLAFCAAANIGLTVREEGFVSVREVLKHVRCSQETFPQTVDLAEAGSTHSLAGEHKIKIECTHVFTSSCAGPLSECETPNSVRTH